MKAAGKAPHLSERDLESLLAEGHLSDPRRERVLANVLREIARPESTNRAARRWPFWLAASGAVSVAAAVLLMLRAPAAKTGWQSRGSGASALVVEVGCSGGDLDHCPMGSKLLFRTQLAAHSAYLVAYADPAFPGGERIWYWAGEQSPLVAASEEPILLDRGIRLGPPHVPGVYTIHLILARQPLPQGDLAATAAADRLYEQTTRLTVVP